MLYKNSIPSMSVPSIIDTFDEVMPESYTGPVFLRYSVNAVL